MFWFGKKEYSVPHIPTKTGEIQWLHILLNRKKKKQNTKILFYEITIFCYDHVLQ